MGQHPIPSVSGSVRPVPKIGGAVKELDSKHFHKLYGVKRPRMTYQKKDYLDYTIMTVVCVLAVLAYGADSVMWQLGVTLCVTMNILFLARHGVELGVPIVLRRPQDILYMIIYKIQNMQPMFLLAVAVFAIDNYLISKTPSWPHHSELMRSIALYLFYAHFIAISVYRTVILIAHLKHRQVVREVLLQSNFRVLISRRSITLHVLHAYFTGLLTHAILIAPWYLVITHLQFSVITLAVMCIINFAVHGKYIKGYNAWFYRDHWLGHNSEVEFLYLHGTHHDAIPSGLIGVSGNGLLEGFLRHSLGNPMPFYNPIVAFLLYTLEVVQDINMHQYIPGIFPRLPRQTHETSQHSTHHWGRLEPYSIALRAPEETAPKLGAFKFPAEILNSIALDERLGGFKWDNPKYREFLRIFDTYQK